MSDTTTLRDHDDECEHGFKYSHRWTTPRLGTPPKDFQRFNKGGGDRWTDHHVCPGGRERTFRRMRNMEVVKSDELWVEVTE